VHVVSYREDASARREPRCRLWVDLSGRVLKQEAALLGSKMTFLRRTDEAAAWLVESVAARAEHQAGSAP
jgi:1,2-phenylacetyl-CoA epoxidase PaaB subunit